MKDLDFDELDRAVNSLITNKTTPTTNSAATTPSAQPVSSLPTLPVVPLRPAVERPSTGRFMDVVHPSSDMRTALVMPERTPSQAATTPVPTSPVTPVVDSPSVKNEDADIDQISKDIDKTLGQLPKEPLDTPFLAGTKVEKRPLGAFSVEPSAAQTFQSAPVMPKFDHITTKSDQNVAEIDTPLPAELQSDLLSIESDETVQPDEPTDEPTLKVADVVAPVPSVPAIPTPIVPPVIPVAAPKPAVVTDPAISASIPQQYTEQPNSGDKDNGAIYDTKAYHKAMVSPAKKKSGWMWIVWIVLLMVVSVGAGVAAYFFVLPRL